MPCPPTVLALTPSVDGFYFGEILLHLHRELARAGSRLLVVQTGRDRDHPGAAPPFAVPVAWELVDGVASITTAVPDDYLRRAHAAGLPLVVVSHAIADLPVPTVLPDNRGGTRAAVDHLVAHGHRRIGFIGNFAQSDILERRDEYCRALAEHGLAADPADALHAPDNDWNGGMVAGEALLARADRPTAFAVATDRNAIGLIRVLAAAGVRVPEDVAVVGFDDVAAAAFSEPPLTSVDQGFAQVGRRAGRHLLDQIAGRAADRDDPPPGVLVVRESCGCAGDPAGRKPSVGWRQRAGEFLHDVEQVQTALQEQYRVTAAMIAGQDDPGALHWLADTHVPAAVFATWSGDPADGDLLVAGVHGPAGTAPDTATRVEQFPPAALFDAGTGDDAVVIVLPVADSQRDWGLLALVGRVDTSTTLDTYRHWATQLAATLHERQLQAAVRASEERYAVAARATNDGLWERDLRTGAFFVSDRCLELAGLRDSPASRRYDEWLNRVHPDDDEHMRDTMRSTLVGDAGTVSTEYRLRQADGSYRWVLSRAVALRGPGGAPERIVGSLTDIHDQHLLEERLRATALQDELTGLPNRRLFAQRLEQARRLAERDGTPFSVVFLDVDRFKAINDSLGHLVGDRLLAAVAQRLSDAVRSVDTVARFGGDEFAVLLHGIGRQDVLAVAERLQAAVGEPLHLDGHEFVVTASAGLTTDEAQYGCAEDVLRDADTAMYAAKAAERGSVAFFDPTMHAEALRRLRLTADLRRALAEEEFEVHYQPIVNLSTGHGNRFEALVRWRHPQRGLVPPDEFLPQLVESGLIEAMGRWLIGEVCRQLAEWGPRVANVAVNLSDREFWRVDLVPHLLSQIGAHGLTADRLTLEITEGVVMHRPEAAQCLMTQLHQAGFELHIDDFGTGYSSLDSLHRFPVDALKIDRSFVAGIGAGDHSEELVRAIVAMAAALHLAVVAEGVETEAQAAFLRQVGCSVAQGWLFGRPMPAAATTAWLAGATPLLRRPA